jgi:glyoxylase-like metal-dependent hydrolase (beta-lactamase superfamily II)
LSDSFDKLLVKRFSYPEIEEVNTFVVSCPRTGDSLLVDAGGFSPAVDDYLSEGRLSLLSLFVTHAHYDHICAIDRILVKFPQIGIHACGLKTKNGISPIQEGTKIKIGSLEGCFHLIPGHTEDGAVLYIEGHLFTGDVLFAGSVGGTSSNSGYHQQLAGIKTRLLGYHPETIIHPGHGPDSTLRIELMYNPFLRDL